MEEKLILDILESKEKRRVIQENLISKYKSTLISFTLNTPGIKKDNEGYRRIHRETMDHIIKILRGKHIDILHREGFDKSTGPEGYIIVNSSPLDTKSLMIEIEEEHPLGRLLDIDVFNSKLDQISRKDLKLESRKCLICNKDARICMRERSHGLEEILIKVEELIAAYFDLTKK